MFKKEEQIQCVVVRKTVKLVITKKQIGRTAMQSSRF
jgi:hypothetical protein